MDWTEDGESVPTLSVITTSEGTYTYDAEVAGVHTLQYAVGGAVSTTEITVAAQSIVARLDVNLSTDTVEQLESLDVSIRAFDVFDNEIPVPGSIQVESTGRGTAMMTSSGWTITTLDDGPQTITISVGAVRVNEEITVEGIRRLLRSGGGTLYYVRVGYSVSLASCLQVSLCRSCEAVAWTTGTMMTSTRMMKTTVRQAPLAPPRSHRPGSRTHRARPRPDRSCSRPERSACGRSPSRRSRSRG